MTEDTAWRLGQRIVLGGVALLAVLGFALFAVGAAVGGPAGGVAQVAAFGVFLAIFPFGPYAQWLFVLPVAGALHVTGRTMLARGVLRAAFVLFVISGVLYGFCGGLSGLIGATEYAS